jgi:DNA-binding NtrC family response regulator
MAKVLIIDGDPGIPRALQDALNHLGHRVEICTDAAAGLVRAETEDFAAVVIDLHWRTPGTTRFEPTGLEVLARLRETKPQLPVVSITAFPGTETAIQASKLGAYDYLTKPNTTHQPQFEELLQAILGTVGRRTNGSEMTGAQAICMGERPFLGRSLLMQNVYKAIGRVAAKPVNVLIRGETGTGKELVARSLHEHSDRRERPLIVVNCVSIPESLLESELFGHEQGAFTGATHPRIGRFEQASHGTIFLDEVGDMNLNMQAKLLRVLQENTIQRVGGNQTIAVDVRVLAATHRDLEKAVEEKQFRLDLYYRLNDAVIVLPALRERPEDIPELVRFFIERHQAELGGTGSTLSPEAVGHLQQQVWPGNVRELRNAVRKALLLAQGGRIELATIRKVLGGPGGVVRPAQGEGATHAVPSRHPLTAFISRQLDAAEREEAGAVAAIVSEWAEREIYAQAIDLAHGDQTRAADWLGVSRPTMRERLTRFRLHPAKEEEGKGPSS